MNSTALLNLFRAEVRDVTVPPLWSDVEIYGFMDEAQKKFCRLTDGIPDAVSAITSIAVAQGDTFVPYNKAIKSIRRAYRESDKAKVAVINDEELEGDESILTETAGLTRLLVLGMDASNLRIIPEASTADTIKLSVFRLPLVDLDGADVDLEIAEIHHRALLMWMKSLAYSKMDAETFDKVKAADFENQFKTYCVTANSEEKNKNHRARCVKFSPL